MFKKNLKLLLKTAFAFGGMAAAYSNLANRQKILLALGATLFREILDSGLLKGEENAGIRGDIAAWIAAWEDLAEETDPGEGMMTDLLGAMGISFDEEPLDGAEGLS